MQRPPKIDDRLHELSRAQSLLQMDDVLHELRRN